MKRIQVKSVLYLLPMIALFVSCNIGITDAGLWTQAELNNVFDLKQLGELRTVQGQTMLGDKQITPELMSGHTYGKEVNLLNLSPEALEQLPHETRVAVLFAPAKEIQNQLASLGLTVADIRTMQGENSILDVSEVETLVAKVQDIPGGEKMLSSLGLVSSQESEK